MTEIRLSRSRILFWLAVAIFFLSATDITMQWSKYALGHGNLFGLFSLFDLDLEGNFPSWFESLMFLFAAAQLYFIACAKKGIADRWAPHWKLLSFIFVALCADEMISVHERSIEPLRTLLHIHGGYLYYSWIVLGAAFVLAIGIFYLRFFMNLPGQTRRDFIISAALFLGGALVTEAFGGRYTSLHGGNNLTYNLFAAFEETMEMAGLWYWIRSLFIVMQAQGPSRTSEFILKLQ